MRTLTLYIADEDYDRVIQALSVEEFGAEEIGNASEQKAIEVITRWVMQQVQQFDRESHFQGYVFVPPEIVSPEQWVQPEGAHDAYPAGALVLHNGSVWRNTHGDGNVWEPGVSGWELA